MDPALGNNPEERREFLRGLCRRLLLGGIGSAAGALLWRSAARGTLCRAGREAGGSGRCGGCRRLVTCDLAAAAAFRDAGNGGAHDARPS
ncbi:MAG: hypothetical protein HZA54_04650 [Planctomycetes bacterium]|nr:hypothetical protein [Planctomycetota bacterium]